MTDFTYRTHPEKSIDHFTVHDGTVKFFGFVRAIASKLEATEILEFGAGRGAFWYDDVSQYRRELRDLRRTGARVTACDIDKVVRGHPCSDAQVVIAPGAPLPFADATFDVIVSDMTFEHIENPDAVARELLRVLVPGGYICARTPNRFGYVRLVSSLIPNSLHQAVLRYIQPERKSEDVFPAYYRLNSPSQLRRAFPSCSVFHFYDNAEPAYYFGNKSLYNLWRMVHWATPAVLATGICLFVRKPDDRKAA